MNLNGKRIIIAKAGHIGDVIISLPMAAILKQHFPDCTVLFLCYGAACEIAKLSPFVDEVHDWKTISSGRIEETLAALKQLQADILLHVSYTKQLTALAKKAGIPVRAGSLYRWQDWLSCNSLAKISRGRALLNKRQLDLQYLNAVKIKRNYSHEEIISLYQFKVPELPARLDKLLAPGKFKLILHPTLITAKEYRWPLEHYAQLIKLLPPEQFQIFITGTKDDRAFIEQDLLTVCPEAIDLLGEMNLQELMAFILRCDGLIAGSTGPAHIAAAAGIHTLGIYPANSAYIQRWAPIGKKAEIMAQSHSCKACPQQTPCQCITSISPEQIKARVLQWLN